MARQPDTNNMTNASPFLGATLGRFARDSLREYLRRQLPPPQVTEPAFRKRLLQPFLESPAFPPGKGPVLICACNYVCASENQIGPMFPDRREAVSSGHS